MVEGNQQKLLLSPTTDEPIKEKLSPNKKRKLQKHLLSPTTDEPINRGIPINYRVLSDRIFLKFFFLSAWCEYKNQKNNLNCVVGHEQKY